VTPKPAAPPTEPPPKAELKVPYDSEIPAEYLDLLRRVFRAADEAVPLIFLAMVDHFCRAGEDDSAFHFLDKAADGFVREKNRSGEAAAWSRKVVLSCRISAGRQRRVNSFRGAGEAWKHRAPGLSRYNRRPSRPAAGGFPRAIFCPEPVAPG